MNAPYLEIEGYSNTALNPSYMFARGSYEIDVVETFVSIFHETQLVIKKAQVHARSIDLMLEDDTQLTAYVQNTDATFMPSHQRTFGHDPQGREPIEGECLKAWSVIRESNGQVTMYVTSGGGYYKYGTADCNQYGIPIFATTASWDKPKHLQGTGSPLHMKMDGWRYIDSEWLKCFKYENAFTFEGARILYTGDRNSTNNYDPC